MNAQSPTALNPKKAALFLDVDGTLIDFAPKPDDVVVPAGLVDDLASAERRLGGALALLSGRSIGDLDRLFAPLQLRIGGIHGAEIRDTPCGDGTATFHGHLSESAWCDLSELLRGYPGTFAENKGVSFAVHYPPELAPATELRAALEALAVRFAERDLELVAGHRVFELKFRGFDKGKAISRFMAREPFAGRRPVFVSDSRIDQAGFEAALDLGGMAYSVGDGIPGLTGNFPTPTAVRAWLRQLAQ
jgi:trehalose 6-phosphate phosphatase